MSKVGSLVVIALMRRIGGPFPGWLLHNVVFGSLWFSGRSLLRSMGGFFHPC